MPNITLACGGVDLVRLVVLLVLVLYDSIADHIALDVDKFWVKLYIGMNSGFQPILENSTRNTSKLYIK